MRLTRWKLMAGVLGLSMCGLAALAEPACRSVGLTRRADDTKPEPVEASKPVPLPVPAPPPATEVPPAVIPTFDEKKPLPLPSPTPVDVKPVAMPANDPKLPPAVDIKLLEEVAKTQNPPIPLPSFKEQPVAPLPAPIPVPAPKPVVADTTPPAPKAIDPIPTPVTPLPSPATPTSREPLPAPVPAPLGTPTPVPQPSLVAVPDPVMPVKADLPTPAPRVDLVPEVKPAPEAVKPAGVVAAKKLKVLLHLSDEKPWFEVRDGEELVLKVTADAVSLEAAASGKTTSTLTATSGVTFRTLGGFGTCDELKVVPGTGEVVVTGKVAVTSNWGKAETTATADKMTFRLGTDAGKK